MKKILSLIFILFICNYVKAQTTVTTATPLFPDGNSFAGGTVQAVFTPPTGIIDQNLYLLNGNSFPYLVTGVIDVTGQFNITLTDDHAVRPLGGRWMFTVCSAASIPCTISLQDVFGASIDLSTLITANVRPIFSAPAYFPIYFQDSEVDNNINGGTEYFDYLSKTFRCWNGTSWSNCGGGGGGGGGSVVSFAAGNLPPVFTTSVANATTTPVLSFILTNAAAHTVLANETGSSAPPSYQTDALTINTTSPLTGGALVHLGGSITLDCPTCSVPQVSVTATSPIVVTPTPGVSTMVISCPTCGTNTGTLTNFTSGNLSPLFTTSVSNPTTAPALSFSLSNAAANTVYANLTGSSALPSFTTTQGTDNKVLSSGSVSGTGSILCTDSAGGATTVGCSNGGGANTVPFESCTADQSTNKGNTYWRGTNYTATGISNDDIGAWGYKAGLVGSVVCKSLVPSNASGTTHVILDLAANDSTAGHTAAFKIAYACSSSQNINNLTYTVTSTQNYVSTTTIYANTRLDFTTTSCTIGEYFIAAIFQDISGTNTSEIEMTSHVKWF
jgi:hypothetical protein